MVHFYGYHKEPCIYVLKLCMKVHFEEAEKEKKFGEKMTIEALKAGFRKNV